MSNSLVYSLVIALICTGLAYPATYVISRYKFRIRTLASSIMYFVMLTPSTILIFPVFIMATLIKIQNTAWGYILVMIAILGPFAFFLMKPYIDSIPIEIEESALVDGASSLQLLLKVVVPLSINGLIVTFFLIFVTAFNDFGIAFGMLTSDSIKTFPLLLFARIQFLQWQGSWNDILSMSLLALVPTMIVFLLFFRRLQEAILKGGVKV
ncbi:MAG: carbohydrate ABC transporter permease [Nitrososphaerales archaeon]